MRLYPLLTTAPPLPEAPDFMAVMTPSSNPWLAYQLLGHRCLGHNRHKVRRPRQRGIRSEQNVQAERQLHASRELPAFSDAPRHPTPRKTRAGPQKGTVSVDATP